MSTRCVGRPERWLARDFDQIAINPTMDLADTYSEPTRSGAACALDHREVMR
jgi:hypothetical protein